jgi:hypothetical protein
MKKLILGILLISFVLLNADVPPLLTTTKLGDASYQLMMVENLTGGLNAGLEATLREFMDGKGQSSGLYISKAASQTNKIALQFYDEYKLSLRDAGLLIYSSANGQLDIDADTELEFGVGKLDINASDNITIDTSDNTKTITIGETSGTAVNIGHTTSQTTVSDDLDVTGDVDIDGDTLLDNVRTDGTITSAGTTIDIDMTDDIDIDTTDGTGGLALATANSGIPITIGHTTSETTVRDNLTVTGTSTLTDAVTMSSTLATGGKLTAGANEIEGSAFDVNGGYIDATVIGDDTPAAGSFTTITNSGTITSSSDILLGGNDLILESTGNDTKIDAGTDNQIEIHVDGADEIVITASAMHPFADQGIDLGTTTRDYRNIYTSDITVSDDAAITDDASVGGDLTITGAVNANGNVQSGGLLAHDGTPQSLSGAGAINATTTVTLFTSTGADALTIANGTINGQMKYIIHIVDGGAGTLTGANLLGTSVVFTNAGENAILMWVSSISDWVVVGVSEDIYTP